MCYAPMCVHAAFPLDGASHFFSSFVFMAYFILVSMRAGVHACKHVRSCACGRANLCECVCVFVLDPSQPPQGRPALLPGV